jgi:Zn-dependent peptidase ImmA (M78 family)
MNKQYNGEILKLLRKSKNLSQGEICARLNIFQGNFSKIEQGLMEPSENFIAMTASFFGVKNSFFYQDEGTYSPVNPYHRSRSTLHIGDRDRAEAKANIFRIHLKKLLDSDIVEIQYRFMPIPVSESATPKEIARLTRKNLRLPNGPIQNLTKMLEDNGIIVITYDFKTEALDGFTIHGAKDILPLIFFNSEFPGERIRFTLAHELAHLIMHQQFDSDQKHDIEKEANIFASEFLMPASDIISDLRFINTIKLNVERLLQLKYKWKVSINALLKRAEDLNVLTKNQTKYLWMQMAKNGYRTKEPCPLPIEKPTLLKELLNVYKEQLQYSSEDLANLLQVSKEIFDEYFEDEHILRVLRIFRGEEINQSDSV